MSLDDQRRGCAGGQLLHMSQVQIVDKDLVLHLLGASRGQVANRYAAIINKELLMDIMGGHLEL